MKKYLTVSELEQGDARDPIWALNGSAQSEIQQSGEVHVGIPKMNGTKIDPLLLLKTWLPQELTVQIPRAQLLAASEFRNAVNTGLIQPITPEYAEILRNREGAEEERAEMAARKQQTRNAMAARTITQSGAEILNTSDINDETKNEKKSEELDDVFMTFASSLETKNDIEALNALRSRGKISRREARHLVKTLIDKPKTVGFLKQKLG